MDFLTGLCPPPLAEVSPGLHVHRDILEPWNQLRNRGQEAGFNLQIVSGHRDFFRQRTIWNAKAQGDRPIFRDDGTVVDCSLLSEKECVFAIMRYCALPGASRHHWGTDIDLVDGGKLGPGQRPELTPAEVNPGGIFAPMHEWLDGEMEAGQALGFYRPYAHDLGGVAPERWHLSFAPLAQECASAYSLDMFLQFLEQEESQSISLHPTVRENAEEIFTRFITQTAPAPS